MQKKYIAANELLLDSFRLAATIYASGFRPDFLVGLWRGGSSVGIAVQEGLEYCGVETDHIAIRTSYRGQHSYSQMVDKAETIQVHGLRYLHERVCEHHSMLIVDDVYSTGSSVNAVIRQLSKKARRNLPGDIRIATVWYRPTKRTIRPPDFYIHEASDWLVLPYELTGLSLDELRDNKHEIQPVMDRLEKLVAARKD
jgi:hypoxanthine phosphoribosyltransferase